MAKNEINMTEGPLFGKIVRFSLPVMLSSILQLLFNAVDTVVVGQFIGDEALAAVGSTGSLINLIIGLFVGIPTGTTVLVAQFYGSKHEKDVSEVVHTSALTAIIFGILLTLVGQFFCRLFLEWTNVPKDVIDLAERYLRIYFLGCPVMLLYNFLAAALRAIGDTKRPLIYLTIGSAVNLGFNLLFVIVFHMSVEGVAIPTVMSQAVSAVLVTICLAREKGVVRLSLKDLKIHRDKFWKILRIGVPAGLQGVAFSISNVIVQASLNGFGKLAMAGATAAGNLENFVSQATNAFSLAAISFTAQNAGAKKYKRINGVFWRIALLVTVIGAGMGVGIYLAGPELLRIYTSTPE
ncbi:MAG: MATE family efflux transporter, partial [Lachnospiraceae bacterium]|nr:MATE family efflux transporter [Lachnospiraceae bacterium]